MGTSIGHGQISWAWVRFYKNSR